MKRLRMALIFMLLLFFGCSDGLKDMETSFTIKVTGSEQLKFSGHYTIVRTTNLQKPVHVDAIVPMEFKGKGIAAACMFRKVTAEGTLKVEILKDGKVISQVETAQPFGIVSLGKVPDANSMINKILGMILG